MTPINKLLSYFKKNQYRAISLDWLVEKSGKSRGTVLRYISQVRRMCPRGWRLRKTCQKNEIHGGYDYWYTYCPSVEYFRKQQTIWRESA